MKRLLMLGGMIMLSHRLYRAWLDGKHRRAHIPSHDLQTWESEGGNPSPQQPAA